MLKFKIYLYYYLGHSVYLLGMRYYYILGSYSIYNWSMNKSAELDTEELIWKSKAEIDE
jgi:hypothetical protein